MTNCVNSSIKFPDGRPDGKGAATRLRILEVAIPLFGERGFRQTSVTEVARAAQLTPPAVHAHFPTKAELFEAAFEHDATAFLDVLRDAAGRVGLNGLAEVMPTGVIEIATRPLVRRVFQGLEPEMTPRLMELDAVRGVRAALIERLEAGQADGVIRADMNSAELAVAIETLLLALLLAAVQAGPLMDGSRRQALIAVLQHGVLSPPKRRR